MSHPGDKDNLAIKAGIYNISKKTFVIHKTCNHVHNFVKTLRSKIEYLLVITGMQFYSNQQLVNSISSEKHLFFGWIAPTNEDCINFTRLKRQLKMGILTSPGKIIFNVGVFRLNDILIGPELKTKYPFLIKQRCKFIKKTPKMVSFT